MNKKRTDIKRRHLVLGSIGVSAALPTQWTKPLVNSVLTPTHAQMSPITFDGAGTFSGPIAATDATGVRIVWTGPATNAPFCVPVEPIDDITFTVTATCDDAFEMETYTEDFTLSDILA